LFQHDQDDKTRQIESSIIHLFLLSSSKKCRTYKRIWTWTF